MARWCAAAHRDRRRREAPALQSVFWETGAAGRCCYYCRKQIAGGEQHLWGERNGFFGTTTGVEAGARWRSGILHNRHVGASYRIPGASVRDAGKIEPITKSLMLRHFFCSLLLLTVAS